MAYRPPQYLSKSDYMRWKICPAYAWMAKHMKELVPDEPDQEMLQRRFDQGDLIESYARQLYPDGPIVRAFGQGAADFTRTLINEGKPAIYQATALSADGLMARADVLERVEGGYALWEVKSSMRVKDEHLLDVAFQRLAFTRAGINIVTTGVVHLNRDYVRRGELDPQAMFTVVPTDEKVAKLQGTIEKEAAAAFNYLSSPLQPSTCTCNTKPRWEHCPTFNLFHPDVPEYSIFHLSKLGARVIKDLASQKQYRIEDVPEGVKLSDKAANQVLMVKTGRPSINVKAIKDSLAQLTYPLYFLDYETTTSGLPLYDNTKPYQNVPFQYSLHVLREPEGELEHYEYLATNETENPVDELCQQLQEEIGPEGSVIVWYKEFEMGRNREMGSMEPQHREFLEQVNERVYDLMEVFWDQHYLHPGFKGSASIKAVLPVLCPELSYDNLAVRKGDKASALWEDALSPDFNPNERENLYHDLLEYCKLDTLAMVKVYQHLLEICGQGTPQPTEA
jgi:hypothetical protein